MKHLENLLMVAGVLHFAILGASALTPKALDWRGNLAVLHPFLRKLFWVYGWFIVLVIVAFGVLTICFRTELAAGTNLARGLAAFIGVFWLARLGVQFFVFEARPFLTNRFFKIGYHGLTFVFAYLVFVFGWAALRW